MATEETALPMDPGALNKTGSAFFSIMAIFIDEDLIKNYISEK
jgi:hypothetical protein